MADLKRNSLSAKLINLKCFEACGDQVMRQMRNSRIILLVQLVVTTEQ